MEFRKIEVVPISGNIGALINGAQINALNDETFEEVYQAWLDHCVIFFRGQKITPREQINFAQRFGEIHFHPYMKGLDDHPEILEIIKEPDWRNVLACRIVHLDYCQLGTNHRPAVQLFHGPTALHPQPTMEGEGLE